MKELEHNKEVSRAEFLIVALLILFVLLYAIISRMVEPLSSGRNWETPEDLNGATFAAISSSTYIPIIRERFPDSDIVYVTDWVDQDISVSQGKADAVLVESSSVELIMEEYPELVALPEPVGYAEYCFGFAKTDKGYLLMEQMNAFISRLQTTGELDEMWGRWEEFDAAPEAPAPVMLDRAPEDTVDIVTSLDWPPMAYLNGNSECGFMIDVAYRFLEEYGYDYTIENLPIESALAGFEAGKYDFCCYGMMVTEEGAESIYYTDPIYEEPIYVMINKADYSRFLPEDSTPETFHEAADDFFRDIQDSFNKTFVTDGRWHLILSGLGVTIAISALSGLFGTLLSALICFMRMSKKTWVTAFARVYIKTIQGIPVTVLLMILYYVILSSSRVTAFWTSVIGFSIDFSAYVSEIMRSGIESVPEGQKKAATALGFDRKSTFFHVVIPQAVIMILPVYMGQFIAMVKMTSVAGYISVLDLTKISDLIRSRTYEAFFPLILTAVIYFIVAWMLTLVLRFWSKRIDPASRPRVIKGVKMHAD